MRWLDRRRTRRAAALVDLAHNAVLSGLWAEAQAPADAALAAAPAGPVTRALVAYATAVGLCARRSTLDGRVDDRLRTTYAEALYRVDRAVETVCGKGSRRVAAEC